MAHHDFALPQEWYALVLASRQTLDLWVPGSFDGRGAPEYLRTGVSRHLAVNASAKLLSPEEDNSFGPAPFAYLAEMARDGSFLRVSRRELIEFVREEDNGIKRRKGVSFILFVVVNKGAVAGLDAADEVDNVADDQNSGDNRAVARCRSRQRVPARGGSGFC